MADRSAPGLEAWPALDVGDGRETVASLTLWAQIIGKTRLALCPMTNHWWQVALHVTARGLGTSPIPAGDRTFDVEIDLLDHQLVVRASDGGMASMPLCDGSLAGFYADYTGHL